MSLKNPILKCAQKALDTHCGYLLFLPKVESQYDHFCKFYFHCYNTPLLRFISDNPAEKQNDPLLPPFDKNIHICDLTDNGTNHHLLVNKFMQCKGHIVLSSRRKDAKQGDKLEMEDFCSFQRIFNSFDNNGLVYYNSGLMSGCSQLHKHLQYTPIDKSPVLDAMVKYDKDNEKRLPFRYHFVEMFNHKDDWKTHKITAEEMNNAYKELTKMSRKDDPDHTAYNFLISKGIAFYVPRRVAQHKTGIVINSFAVAGHYSIWEWSDPIIKRSPMSILKDVCFPIK